MMHLGGPVVSSRSRRGCRNFVWTLNLCCLCTIQAAALWVAFWSFDLDFSDEWPRLTCLNFCGHGASFALLRHQVDIKCKTGSVIIMTPWLWCLKLSVIMPITKLHSHKYSVCFSDEVMEVETEVTVETHFIHFNSKIILKNNPQYN